ncbi:hypothetical protein GCM10008018_45730 [Paenibacillus marchantiophytorum]|uniref:site-specific DNA-methyltransferase (adenine-specific) n=1 Tax=Paenibacillus marchantiophytorum TaxID=1619310 RepID=A0ABQ1EZF2_9BACL|nr:N-6 DNA methylase [Paenibacillus marchantiophytorum]GFZ94145.1 hypothetical protein GCM10008018_45730 [Paenibacillus marchantiophytorum]
MFNEHEFREFSDELWKAANQDGRGDSTAIIEHISYILYCRFKGHDYFWNDLISIINANGAQQATEFYQKELRSNIRFLFSNDSEFSPLPFGPNAFERIIYLLDINFSYYSENELIGKLFESLLDKAYSQKSGINTTPRLLANSMARMLIDTSDLASNELSICDPTCGTGTLLISIIEQLGLRYQLLSNPIGFEINTLVSRIAQLNMIFRGLPSSEIHNKDSLSLSERHRGKFDFVITNPPISKRYDRMPDTMWYSMGMGYSKNGTRSYEFIELALSLLKRQGRCAIIVPEGMLSSNVRYDIEFRRNILLNFQVDGVVSLPPGIFPGTGIKTSLLLVSNNPSSLNREIWFYEFDQRPNQLRNDKQLWDELIDSWNMYIKYGKGPDINQDHNWITPSWEIEDKQYQLAASSYRKRVFDRKWLDPNRLINELRELEGQIRTEMDELFMIHSKERTESPQIGTNFKEVTTTAAEADLNTVMHALKEHLSEKQKALFDIFVDAQQPLAIHEAAKLVNKKLNESTKLGVQEAKQFTELLQALGLIEAVSSGVMLYPKQSSEESDRIVSFHKPINIILWKRATNLLRS